MPIAVMCRQVAQGTTDDSGALGFAAQPDGLPTVLTWTYNQSGQVLTDTDAVGTTVYVYYADTTGDHNTGDLQSITDPMGKVTSFQQYDRYGNVLQSTNVNGVTTVNNYDLRQRLISTSVGFTVASCCRSLARISMVTVWPRTPETPVILSARAIGVCVATTITTSAPRSRATSIGTLSDIPPSTSSLPSRR